MRGGAGGGGRGAGSMLFFFIWGCFDRRWDVQNISFIFSFLVLLKEMRMWGQSNPFLCFRSFRNLPPSQQLWRKSSKSTLVRMLRTWASVIPPKTRQKPCHPLKITGYIHHPNHFTRIPFLHTQFQIKTTLERRIQLQNRNSKVHQPNTHNLTTQHNHAIN